MGKDDMGEDDFEVARISISSHNERVRLTRLHNGTRFADILKTH
jgi:hypothetical protein